MHLIKKKLQQSLLCKVFNWKNKILYHASIKLKNVVATSSLLSSLQPFHNSCECFLLTISTAAIQAIVAATIVFYFMTSYCCTYIHQPSVTLLHYFYSSKTRGSRKNGLQIWNQHRKIHFKKHSFFHVIKLE